MSREKHTQDTLNPRGAERVHVEFEAFLRFEKWPALQVAICDLSPRGFKCRTSEMLMIGSRVILRIQGVGQYSATIRWQIGGYAGARFDSRLPHQTVMAILLPILEAQEASRPVTLAE